MPGNVQQIMNDATRLARSGQLAEAARRYQQVLSMDPANIRAAANLGEIVLQSGQPDAAANIFSHALQHKPDEPDLLTGLGLALLQLGRRDDGKSAIRRALENRPTHGVASYTLGLALAEEGAFDEAHDLFARFVRKQPKHIDGLMNLGLVCLQTGKTAEAHKHLKRAAFLAPGNAVVQMNYANLLADTGRLDEAIRILEKLVAANPDMPDALFGLALCHERQGHPHRAVEILGRILSDHPDFGQAHGKLGLLLKTLGRLEEAEFHSRKAVELIPAEAELQYDLAEILFDHGKEAEGFAILGAILEKNPRSIAAHYSKGAHLQRAGHFELARAVIETIKAIDPGAVEAFRLQSVDGGFPFSDDDIARIDMILADQNVGEEDKSHLNFVLAGYFDGRRDFDHAFAAAVSANRYLEQALDYDSAAREAHLERIETVFDADFFARRREVGMSSNKPVFIIGMPRSCTSLVEKILASHSRVDGAGELPHFNAIRRALVDRAGGDDYPECLDRLEASEAREIAAGYVGFLDQMSPSAAHVTDKMPDNLWNVGLIHLLLPDAKFVYCERDALDTCLSIFFQDFVDPLPYACALDRLAHYYTLNRRILAHWRRIGMPIHMLDYARLLDDPRGQITALLGFLDLPWEESCLDYQSSAANVASASLWQVRQPLYRSSLGRSGNYADHLAELKARLSELPVHTFD